MGSRSLPEATIAPTWARRDALLYDLEEAFADELLVLDEGDVRLDAGGIAIHHEGDSSGGREQRGLGVAEAVGAAQLQGVVPDVARGAVQIRGDAGLVRDGVGGVAVLLDDAEERLLVLAVFLEGAAVVAGD